MRGLTARIVGLVALTLCLGCCELNVPYEDEALLFHIVFDDAQGVTVGSPLVFKGVTIGDVTDVMLTSAQELEPIAPCELDRVSAADVDKSQVACVSVRIDAENRSLVRTDSDFRIRRSALISIPDEKHIEMAVWDSESPELPEGTTVVGCNSLLDLFLKRVQRLGERGLVFGELSIRTELQEDGGIKRVYVLETSGFPPAEMVLDDLLPQGVDWEATRPENGDGKILQVSRTLPSVDALTGTNSDISFEAKKSLLGSEYVYAETFLPGQLEGADQDLLTLADWREQGKDWYDRMSTGRDDTTEVLEELVTTILDQIVTGAVHIVPLDRVVAVVSVKMPGEIVADESNAHLWVGNEASWLLTAEDLNQGFDARVVARQGLLGSGQVPPGLIPGVIAAIAVLGVMVVCTRQRVKRLRSLARFDQDGAGPDDANDREMSGDHQSDDLGLDYDESDY